MGRRIRVKGQVQGVGFRPFVWRLARSHGIVGTVSNDAGGVLVLAAGADLDAFEAALAAGAPALARVDAVESWPHRFDPPPTAFHIADSGTGIARTGVTPDAAVCADCLADIAGRDPRRRGYAFTNCTHCGPRFSILRALPYDRAQTSMADFAMCETCAAEYADPGDRRFHAQPVACTNCGPRLWMEEDGQEIAGEPIALTLERLRSGKIIAIKGLGGFHLCCDGGNAMAVATLRARKRRPGKPLALMDNLARIHRYATVTPAEEALLTDPAAPVVLLSKAGDPLPDAIAPGLAHLGVMLPYTPLHALLVTSWDGGPLVMTSANRSGEPQVIGNDAARHAMIDTADAYLMHDRDIVRRLDDGVERTSTHGPMVLRRARGRSPATLPMPPGFEEAPQVLAFGGQLKSTICLTKDGRALLSHHLGDLDDALTWDEYRTAEADYAALFDHAPEVFAVDLHPGYRATQHGAGRAGAAALLHVQHHHAHLAAVMGDAGWGLESGPVAGIILDGLGYGEDGTIWGGELLVGDYHGFHRAAHLATAPLPGGDAAQQEPWRNLLVRLDAAGLSDVADEILSAHPVGLLRQAVNAGVNAPQSSSAGRLFDAVAAALDLTPKHQSYEGEAAMLLEALAQAGAGPGYEFNTHSAGDGPVVLDPSPVFRAVVEDQRAGRKTADSAYRFHAGLADAFAGQARRLVESGDAQAVALSGGCFQNVLLLEMTVRALGDVPVLLHRDMPANDGGLAFGQALVAAARSMRPLS